MKEGESIMGKERVNRWKEWRWRMTEGFAVEEGEYKKEREWKEK